jgi:hypothetical protein
MFSVGIKGNHVTKLAVGMQVMFTKADVTRKPGLARGPVAYILRLSIPLLDRTRIDYQTQQSCLALCHAQT